jgi:uncharacterized protein (DUF983 family)
MAVSSRQIIARGLTNRCPNCGGRTLFRSWIKPNDVCPNCGLALEKEEGFFLGSLAINYGITALPLVAIFVLIFMGRISVPVAMVSALAWCLLFPVLFFHTAKSLWLMLYYLSAWRELPANQPDAGQVMDAMPRPAMHGTASAPVQSESHHLVGGRRGP